MIVAIAVLLATQLFVVFGGLSDRIGRLRIILAGRLLGVLTYFRLFHALSNAVNPELTVWNDAAKITVTSDPAQCQFTIFPTAGWTTHGDCDKGKSLLTSNGISFVSAAGAAGSKATLEVNGTKVEGFSGFGWSKALAGKGYLHLTLSKADVVLTKDQTKGSGRRGSTSC